MDAGPPPSPPAVIIAERAQDHQPVIMLGFTATGPAVDLDALATKAQAAGLAQRRATNDRNEPELMVIFPPGSARSAALGLYRDARNGVFNGLRLEVVVVPAPAGATRASLKDASAEEPSDVNVPER